MKVVQNSQRAMLLGNNGGERSEESRVSHENHPYGQGFEQKMVKREPVFANRNLCVWRKVFVV